MAKVTVEILSERYVVQISGDPVGNFETSGEAWDLLYTLQDALELEYEDGYSTGSNDGFTRGYDEGHEEGYSEGYDVGVIDGSPIIKD